MDILIISWVLGIMMIVGGVKTFLRNWALALLLILLLTPVWVVWALIECFIPIKCNRSKKIVYASDYKPEA